MIKSQSTCNNHTNTLTLKLHKTATNTFHFQRHKPNKVLLLCACVVDTLPRKARAGHRHAAELQTALAAEIIR